MERTFLSIKIILTRMVCLFIFSQVTFIGCTTAIHKSVPLVDPWPVVQELRFPEDLRVSDEFLLEDKEDPKEMVLFAILLFKKGKYVEAKKYFIKTGNAFSSLDGKFEKATFSAAMLSALRGGDIDEFTRMEKFFEEKLLTPEERIKPPLELSTLIALGRYSRNKLEDFPIGTSPDIVELLKKSPKRSLQ